ncbi:thioredoxin reductase (NADPH) [Pseudonocardia ammonioxydans]|uniref:Thioredoxin reductase (NADPH) n=2 Tax=Pseudonocardia ammonioxydans TaxID=260086 RepID=A0A1I4TYI6_PSUAM|nr:hypothetical protein [Pseudonocardia ammonioxydans]SFM81641.1 thioredoxin reductase (NADPH) [Pseudonocardia ammonioxydans]
MRIIDPTYGTPSEEASTAVAGDRPPAGTLCLFSNSKPGASDLLRGVGDQLGAERGILDVGFAAKPNAAAGADEDQLDHLAARYRMAVVAIGD